MSIFPDNLLNDTEEYLKLSLNKKSDLALIIKAYDLSNNFGGFENLCFIGKYLNGLFKVLKNSANLSEVKNVDFIKKDISENINKIISQLREVYLNLNEEDKLNLQEKYLQLSQNSLQNLQALVEDLDHIKKYLNFLKRNNPN